MYNIVYIIMFNKLLLNTMSGDVNMVWPGLNSPAVKGQAIVRRELLPQNEKRTEALQVRRHLFFTRKNLFFI